MEIKLCKISTYGMKSINKTLDLDFLNETTSRKITSYNLKGIYGRNGSGKTAILESILLYKLLISKHSYLNYVSVKSNLMRLINKEKSEFYFKAYILCSDNEVNKILAHEICLKVDYNNVFIKNESLSLIKGQTINSSNIEIIYNVEDGVMVDYKKSLFNSFIYDKTRNLLSSSSLIALFNSDYMKHSLSELGEYKRSDYDIDNYVEPFRMLGDKIRVYLDSSVIKEHDLRLTSGEDIIESKKLSSYKKYIKKLTSFLKLFNNRLKKIEIKTSIDRDHLHCRKILDYGDFKIESSNESGGIKRLINLYSYLNMSIKGYYVFIDELDTSINNIILAKLIEFFIEYGKGILCFNVNSLELINTLKRKPRSIMFLGSELELVTWTKKGNTNPLNHYKEGFIEGSSYNELYFDFLKAFDME